MIPNRLLPEDRASAIALGSVLAAACVLRVAAMTTDFWFDEIWTWRLARGIAGPGEVFTGIHQEANHYLPTLLLYLLGDSPQWHLYRLHSFAAGTASIVLMGVLSYRGKALEAVTAFLLAGFSYVLILYSTDARGYSLMVFFALMAFFFLDLTLGTGKPAYCLGFSIAALLGFLSHLLFIQFYLAALLWSSWALLGRPRRRDFPGWLRCHLPPAIFLAGLYYVDIRHMVRVGGAEFPLPAVLGDAIALWLGIPRWPAAACLGAGAVAVAVWAACAIMRREKDRRGAFFPLMIFVSPALFVAAYPTNALYARYFILPGVFFLLLLTRLLCRIHQQGPRGRAAYACVLLVVLAGNACRIVKFFDDGGRGRYLEAVLYMAERTEERIVTIGSDHDVRNWLLVSFYAPYLPRGKAIEYYARDAWPTDGPAWYIKHSFASLEPPKETISLGARRYALRKEFHYAEGSESGWNWHLYLRASRKPRPA